MGITLAGIGETYHEYHKRLSKAYSIAASSSRRPRPARLDGCPDPAPGPELAAHHGPDRIAGLDYVFEDLIHNVFLEDSEVAVAEQVLL